ncbi:MULTISPECIES: hypothetical protein [Pseudomonadales]|jgi:hypothetical protein|nr:MULTISPECIES: hypothetical protein [Pseudomonadales]AKH68814.1 hypothetical protein IMCC21906_01135 [Spongiibacter sp. IMCC21906]SFE96978.1 hypothetical protein SAMN04487869_13019 [Marinobacter sp. DSM 26671]
MLACRVRSDLRLRPYGFTEFEYSDKIVVEVIDARRRLEGILLEMLCGINRTMGKAMVIRTLTIARSTID